MTSEAPKELTFDEAKAAVAKLQEKNEQAISRMKAMRLRIDPKDVAAQRDSFFIEWLFETMLTEEQQVAFTLLWQTKLNEAFARTEKNARTAALSAGEAINRARAATASIPGQRQSPGGLILP